MNGTIINGTLMNSSSNRNISSPAYQNLSPPPNPCRQAILRYLMCFQCFFPPGEILKSGVGITFGVPIVVLLMVLLLMVLLLTVVVIVLLVVVKQIIITSKQQQNKQQTTIMLFGVYSNTVAIL